TGASSNLLLLDEGGRILRAARERRGPSGPTRPGEIFPAKGFAAGPMPSRWDRDAVAPLTRATPAGELERTLMSRLPGFSGHLAREIAFRIGRGESPGDVVERVERLCEEAAAPILYAPAAPDALPASRAITSRTAFAGAHRFEFASELAA